MAKFIQCCKKYIGNLKISLSILLILTLILYFKQESHFHFQMYINFYHDIYYVTTIKTRILSCDNTGFYLAKVIALSDVFKHIVLL